MGNRAGSNPVIPTNMETFIIIMIVLFTLTALLFFAVFFILHMAFHRRFDGHPKLKYFTIEDFPEFEFDAVSFRNGQGEELRGGFYYDDQQKHRQLIIFSHGIGAGHQAYTHLMMAFVKQGYLVFAYDNMGCGLSSGKSIRGIPQSILDLESAIHYLDQTTYAAMPKAVVGHSWGAYAAIRSSLMQSKISHIVSISPFHDVTSMVSRYLPWMKYVRGIVNMILLFQFGRKAKQSTGAILETTKIPTLVIVGDQDNDVPFQTQVVPMMRSASKNPHVQFQLEKNRRHNPYLSVRAETYVIDTILKGVQHLGRTPSPTQEQQFFSSLTYDFVGELDPSIMTSIFKFLEK